MQPLEIRNSVGWESRINNALTQRRCTWSYRERVPVKGGNNRLIQYENRCYINFSSNDYLGLAYHPKVIKAWQDYASLEGVGAGGSGHVIGYSSHHQQLEKWLANWLGFPRALLFTSGFAANYSLIRTLVASGDHILADRLSHASLLEAAIYSPATLLRFAHNNPNSLKRLLHRSCNGNRLIVTEGVFSMNGDVAPLEELKKVICGTGSWLMLDDAHGIGVIGEEGRGCSWEKKNQPDLLVVSFGKAVGVSGAAVLCTEQVAEYLLQFARHLIYSTALPPAQIAAIHVALNIVRHEDSLRQRLLENIAYFRKGIENYGFMLSSSKTAIQPLIIGDNLRTLQLAHRLRERGIWLTAMRPPTVPPGNAQLRITLTATHLAEDINMLLEALSNERKG
ncbi:8-amino-7-oxononanoate synthase [Sodalis sp. CWE]|uniref:8-amino-7-oxononanoate synthase n=1 Tax=Sodalis sp. CWE TaxID=2803816 RepID=UPI001C7CEDD4|nr:8-amino-7-oxononanoate synthase [Sodalis sp. CWE]MBX4180953.1 8-amino-7-oxononanoate synthase [Sodalis sp. CWE]